MATREEKRQALHDLIEDKKRARAGETPNLVENFSLWTALGDKIKEAIGAADPLVRLKGYYNEALVCTDRSVFIVKTGLMTGHIFGSDVFQLPYANVAGVQVRMHLLTGYLEISAGGMQNTAKSFWQSGSSSPEKAPNCVAIPRAYRAKFQAAANFIMQRAQEAHTIAPGVAEPVSPTDSPIDAIGKLAALKASGALSEAEFEAKKSELLKRI